MRITLQELWKQFLHGYISAGNTVWEESEEEVKRLTDEFVKDFNDEDCFNSAFIYDYVDYIENNLSDDYKRLYTLYFDLHRYTYQLKKYIRHYFNS